MDSFAWLFPVRSLAGDFFVNFFSGAFSADCFARETSMGSFAGAYLVQSVVGPLQFELLCSGEFHDLPAVVLS